MSVAECVRSGTTVGVNVEDVVNDSVTRNSSVSVKVGDTRGVSVSVSVRWVDGVRERVRVSVPAAEAETVWDSSSVAVAVADLE